MRKSVADVKHTIEEQLIPMINERQHMMDQALEESDILVLSAGKFEVILK